MDGLGGMDEVVEMGVVWLGGFGLWVVLVGYGRCGDGIIDGRVTWVVAID